MEIKELQHFCSYTFLKETEYYIQRTDKKELQTMHWLH